MVPALRRPIAKEEGMKCAIIVGNRKEVLTKLWEFQGEGNYLWLDGTQVVGGRNREMLCRRGGS